MNVLITSISTKVPLIRAVRQAMERVDSGARLYGADSSASAIGRYFVDVFWQMPVLKQLDMAEFVTYCADHRITKVIPTRNEDLLFFSRHKRMLREHRIEPMVSDFDAINRATDKLVFYQFGEACSFPVIPTALSADGLDAARLVVKERRGSGSRNLRLNVSRDQAGHAAEQMEEPLFQPYIGGREFSIDLYLDHLRQVKGVISRERILVRDGESQITRTANEPVMEQIASEMAQKIGLYGHVMFQVIKNGEGVHVVECNPRFGGASTLSLAAGLDSFYWFLLESSGKSLDEIFFIRNEQPLTLIRYPQDLIL